MNARRLVLATLATLSTVAGGLLFSGAAAQAELTHSFIGSFGPAGLSSSPFSQPLGVAVDQSTGDVYVYDNESGVPSIYKFNSAGEPQDFSALGTNVIKGSGEAYAGYSQIAVGSSGATAGDIYVVEGFGQVTVYGENGDRLGELNSGVEADGGPWGSTCGVAVDPAGNVYVGLYESHVDKYTPTGNPVSNSDYVSSLAGLPEGSCNLAADSEGNVYVDTFEGPVTKYEALQFGSLAASGTVIAAHGTAVAIDPAPSHDDLYVDEGSDVAEYDSSGGLLGKFGAAGAGVLSGYSNGIAVNHSSGGVYVSDPEAEDGKGAVNIYGPGIVVPDVSLDPVSAPLATSATLNGTVNPDNAGNATCEFQYATSASYEETGSYDQTVSCSKSVPSGNSPVPVTANVSGLAPNTTYDYRLDATNANGTNYGEDATFTTTGPPVIVSQSSEGIGHYSATIKAQINPGGLETHYHFEYGTSESYGTSTPVPDGTIPAGFAEEGVSANLTGLAIGTTYHFRVVATNADSPTPIYGADQTFTTVPPALISSESVSNVAATSAMLQAQINPLGNDTHYYFQYGTTSCAASPSSCTDVPSLPGTDLGSAGSFQAASFYIEQGLSPGTVYHYRVIATNALGTAEGPEQVFTTQAGGGKLALPDGRAWELVSPPVKDGADIQAANTIEGGVTQASEDGGAITYLANAPLGADEVGYSGPDYTQVFSTRGPGGWSSQDIQPPIESPPGVTLGFGQNYKFFSSDLSLGLVQPQGSTALSPEAQAVRTLYLHGNPGGGYLPLLTTANVAPGATVGSANPRESAIDPEFVGSTPDLSHVVFTDDEALTTNAVKSTNESGRGNLYEWAAGKLQLVNVLPNDQPTTDTGFAAPELGFADQDVRHAISNDGSHIVWSYGLAGAHGQHLYMRDMTTRETVQLDAAQPGTPEPSTGDAVFQTASSDGSKVFFTDPQRLTAGSTASGEEYGTADLYEFEVTSGSGEPLAGRLTDLTVDEHAGESAGVLGSLPGVSEDGSYVYFVANGVLAPGATPGDCEVRFQFVEESRTCNLYVSHDSGTGWTTTFIATLSNEDAPDWGSGESEYGDLRDDTSRVSPSGRYLAFMSERSLTGYDNTDANSGMPDEEVFLYDASAPRLICASCDPTGARPVGVLDQGRNEKHEGGLLIDQLDTWVSGGAGVHWLAGSVPGWMYDGRAYALYQSRYLSDSGRLFFNSPDALVPQDTNGKENVYEYEPPASEETPA
ncbi:MAG TPA: hypothetical protein VFG23_28300, partial [Polyangia bacterium]|nr:hypothetical protein [Polyangia bacterium]